MAPRNTPSISHFNINTPAWVSQDSTRASHVLKCTLFAVYSDRAKAGHVMVGCAIYACYFCKTSPVMHVEHVLRTNHINRQRNLISQCRDSVSRIPRELTNLLANCHLKHYAVAHADGCLVVSHSSRQRTIKRNVKQQVGRTYAVPASVNTHRYCYLYCFITVCTRAPKRTYRSITGEIFVG